MSTKPTPIFKPPPAELRPGHTTVRITTRELNGAYCVCEMITMPGDGVPLHVQRDEEFYYILKGTLEMQAGDERFRADAGSIVVIPSQVPHSFRNVGREPVRALMIFRPGGFDEMLDDLHRKGALGEGQRKAILGRWGVDFLEEDE